MSWIVRKRPAVASAAAAGAPKKVGRREDDRNDRNSAIPVPEQARGKMAMPNAMKHGFNKPVAVVNRDVVIGETITVADSPTRWPPSRR